jgi:uncharacterized protein (TIGR03083 family)
LVATPVLLQGGVTAVLLGGSRPAAAWTAPPSAAVGGEKAILILAACVDVSLLAAAWQTCSGADSMSMWPVIVSPLLGPVRLFTVAARTGHAHNGARTGGAADDRAAYEDDRFWRGPIYVNRKDRALLVPNGGASAGPGTSAIRAPGSWSGCSWGSRWRARCSVPWPACADGREPESGFGWRRLIVMTTELDPRIAALRASHDHLLSIGESLTPEQLRERGYPTEWTIAQVLSHLGSGAEIGLLTLDAGLAGAEPPSRESLPAIWDRWNNKNPDDQTADSLRTNTAYVERIETNAESTATFMSWAGPVDLGRLVGMRLAELAMHTWDVHVMLDQGATVLPDAVPHMLDVIGRMIGFVAKPAGWSGAVRVITTNPDHEYALTLGEKSSLVDWPGDGVSADAALTLPAEAFVRLLYGRLDADHTPAGITAEGVTLDQLRVIFPGF